MNNSLIDDNGEVRKTTDMTAFKLEAEVLQPDLYATLTRKTRVSNK